MRHSGACSFTFFRSESFLIYLLVSFILFLPGPPLLLPPSPRGWRGGSQGGKQIAGGLPRRRRRLRRRWSRTRRRRGILVVSVENGGKLGVRSARRFGRRGVSGRRGRRGRGVAAGEERADGRAKVLRGGSAGRNARRRRPAELALAERRGVGDHARHRNPETFAEERQRLPRIRQPRWRLRPGRRLRARRRGRRGGRRARARGRRRETAAEDRLRGRPRRV